MDLRKRLWHAKWHIVSGVLSVALTLYVAATYEPPKPPPRLWPPGILPQTVKQTAPPLGDFACDAEGAPAPVVLRFCMAGPDKGLETCDVRLEYVDGAPSHCAVAACPPLPAHASGYEVSLGCFLQDDPPQ